MAFPTACQFYPVLFGHGSTSMYINCKGGARAAWAIGTIFGEACKSRTSMFGNAQSSEKLAIGQSMWLLLKTRRHDMQTLPI